MRLQLLFIFLCSFSVATGQQTAVDSLLKELRVAKSNIVKTRLLNLLADEYKTSNPKLMHKNATAALQLAKKIGYKIEEGNAYHHLGNANIILGNYSMALDNFSKAQNVFENELPVDSELNSNEAKDGLARAYGSIGFVFMEQSNYPKALDYNFKALKIYEETENLEKLSRIYNNIGVIYKSQSDYFKAIKYYEKCLEIQEKLGDKNIGITINNIGLVYLNQRNFDDAWIYFSKSSNYFSQHPNTRGLADLNYNIGEYYKQKNNLDKAIDYTQKALDGFNSIDNKFGIANAYANLGSLFFKQKKYNEALNYTTKGLRLANEIKSLGKIYIFELALSEIYESQGNIPQALKHYKQYSAIKDSVVNAETVKNTIRAEMNFEFDKKEMLQREQIIKREIIFNEQEKVNAIKIVFSVLLALFASGIAFLIYNRTQLKKTLTLEKELAIYEQKALHLQMNPHFIFNCLGSISSFIVKNSTDAAIKYLAKFSKLMRLTLEYSKESLIPIDKEIESIQNYLELEQLRFNNKFQFTINKSSEIEDDVALPPLLLQPFIENAIIHGMSPKLNSGLITVAFTINEESLLCTIIDNGIGINKSKEMKENLVSMHKSMALDITKKRLEMVEAATSQKAKVTIIQIEDDSEILGTKVEVVLPLQFMSNTDLNKK